MASKYGGVAVGVEEEEEKTSGSKYGGVPLDPSDPTPSNKKWSLLDDVVKPAWEGLDVSEDVGRPLLHAVKGVPKGLLELGDIPHYLTEGQNWIAEKTFGEENLDALAGTLGGLDIVRSPEVPLLTKALEQNQYTGPVYDAIAGSEYAEGEEVPGWAEAARVGAEWGAAGPVNALRKSAAKYGPDVAAAIAAAGGNVIDQQFDDSQWGEVTGGLLATLASLRKGNVTNLSSEDQIALDYLIDVMGESYDEAIENITTAVRNGEAGTLAELARNRGLADAQTVLERGDDTYSRGLQRQEELRDQQILDEVTKQFGESWSTTPDAATQSAEAALARQETQTLDEARAAAEAARPEVPLDVNASQERLFKARLEEQAALDAQSRIDEGVPEVRAANTEATVPEVKREEVFGGVDRSDPEAMYKAEEEYWAPEGDAFSEVKQYDGTFTLGEDFGDRLEAIQANPETLTQLRNYVMDSLRRVESVQTGGRKAVVGDGEDMMSMDEWMEDLLSTPMSPHKMMALRNYFAQNANRSSNSVDANTNRNIANAFDSVIMGEIGPDAAEVFKQTKEVYPTHLANRDLMKDPSTVLEYGQYKPEAAVRKAAKYDYPINIEANRGAYRGARMAEIDVKQAQQEVKVAEAQLKTAESQAKKIADAEARAIAAGEKRVEGLYGTRLKAFSLEPVETLQKLLKSTRPQDAEEIRKIHTMMREAGSEDEFYALTGKAITDMLNASASGKGATLLPKSVKDTNKYITRLINSGAIDDAGGKALANIVERASVREFLSGGGHGTSGQNTLSEWEQLAASMSAAAALKLLAPGSSSLILANAFRRLAVKLYSNASPKHSVEALKRLTADPEEFVRVFEKSKSDKEAGQALRALLQGRLTEIVGATQAAEIMEGEE